MTNSAYFRCYVTDNYHTNYFAYNSAVLNILKNLCISIAEKSGILLLIRRIDLSILRTWIEPVNLPDAVLDLAPVLPVAGCVPKLAENGVGDDLLLRTPGGGAPTAQRGRPGGAWIPPA